MNQVKKRLTDMGEILHANSTGAYCVIDYFSLEIIDQPNADFLLVCGLVEASQLIVSSHIWWVRV